MSLEPQPSAKLLELPVDILVLIFPLLDARSFLCLTSTCRTLHSSDFVFDSAFWSALTRRDFRVPNQPVVQNDGRRWQRLYRRLRTQSKVFTWGQNKRACLGHSSEPQPASGLRGGLGHLGRGNLGRRVIPRRKMHVSTPLEMAGLEELGVISDLQCGGWSTTLLASQGILYSVGALDGLQFTPGRGDPYAQRDQPTPVALHFPPGLPHPKSRYDPATAIKQFSSGRAHILGLSDSGRIWSWQNIELPAIHVKFVHHTTKEDGRESGKGSVKKVVAGWNKSAALVEGSGIVLWEPVNPIDFDNGGADTALVLETVAVPWTNYVEPAKGSDTDDPTAAAVGSVQNFVLLEECILFSTSLGKVFAVKISWSDDAQSVSWPVELRIPKSKDANSEATFVTDIQGSFRKFAVFTKAGAVLTSDQDRLMPFLGPEHRSSHCFTRIPALQNSGVISLAFGDYHFHALHASGHTTSYGYEPSSCGALGLGGHGLPEGRLRGIRIQGNGGDGLLVPHAYTTGRRVWFEEEKSQWIKFLTSGGVDHSEAAERMRMAMESPNVHAQGELSEWIEQEGRDWESRYNVASEGEDDDGLPAYFALSVAAAGWHSGALVLFNAEKVEKLRGAVEVPEHPEPESESASLHRKEAVNTRPSSLPEGSPSPSNLDTSFWDQATDYGRYFLGMAPYNVSSASYDPNAAHLRTSGTNASNTSGMQHQHPQPLDYGASPRAGVRYVWTNDHFPRLRLRDGTEMPGEVPFDEWRYGRPDWKLDWESDPIECTHDEA